MAPGGFVPVGDGQRADLLQQILIEGQASPHRLALKTISTGRNELQPEEIAEELADLPVGNIQLVAQVGRRGFGRRADVSAGHFSRPGQPHVFVATRTVGQSVAETSYHRARLQHDVFLDVFVNFAEGLQFDVMTVRAGPGCRHGNDLVDVLGFGPLPGRMPWRSAPLLASGRGTLRV